MVPKGVNSSTHNNNSSCSNACIYDGYSRYSVKKKSVQELSLRCESVSRAAPSRSARFAHDCITTAAVASKLQATSKSSRTESRSFCQQTVFNHGARSRPLLRPAPSHPRKERRLPQRPPDAQRRVANPSRPRAPAPQPARRTASTPALRNRARHILPTQQRCASAFEPARKLRLRCHPHQRIQFTVNNTRSNPT